MKSHSHRQGGRRGRAPRSPHADRKLHQLCSQVERTLNYLLSGECDDDVLREFYVESVRPFPDEGHLLVTVAPLMAGTPVDPVRVLERLFVHHEMLRSEVASAIHRRRTPDWRYHVSELPPEAPKPASGTPAEVDAARFAEGDEARMRAGLVDVHDEDEDFDDEDDDGEADPVEDARRSGRWPFARRRGGAGPAPEPQ